MGIVNQTLCDGCGDIVFGRKGIAEIRKDYIEIQGRITMHNVNPDTKWVSHIHLTPTEDEHLCFCSENGKAKLDCLIAYIETRQLIVKNRIEIAKRKRATDELNGEYHSPNRFNRRP